MLGWMILFAFMVILGLLSMVGDASAISARVTCSLFGLLLVVALLTRAARGRAW